MAHANKQPAGSRPGPKPAHSHQPHKFTGGSASGGKVAKGSTPSKTGANPRKLH